MKNINDISKQWKLIFNIAFFDFKHKYINTSLGSIWALITPFVFIITYTLVFKFFLHSDSYNNHPFYLWVVSGVIPWLFINESIVSGMYSLISKKHLVKKIVFPIKLIPIISVVSNLFVFAFSIVILLLFFIVNGNYPDLYYLNLIYYILCSLVLVLNLTYINASLAVFFPDYSQLVNIIMQLLFWFTPIIWDIHAIAEPWIINLVKYNPVAYIIVGFRDSLLDKVWFFEHIETSILFWVMNIVIFLFAKKIFGKFKDEFADVL